MIKSMTGYGKGSATVGTKQITVEVRSLNSKQLDLGVRIPGAWRSAEYELRTLAAARASRGKVEVHVSVEDSSSAGGAVVNVAAFASYFSQIKAAAAAAGITVVNDSELIPAIMRIPDVTGSAESAGVTDDQRAALLQAAGEAFDAFDAFRAQEGALLLADMLGRVDTIRELLLQVEPFEVSRVPAVKARIVENVTAAGVAVDTNRLEQEIVFWVEKLDITEEKVRLGAHCNYFRVTSGEPEAGRKLGFIAQEMGREINTLGSKANDAGIQKLVVRMKDELEKIKEQLLNIL
ncbi:MAG: YicC family protein [Alistipes sp.]|jgi:uncharacterized protein (TIGR00255 family)|nr:YicC family protein [Alistipes sp.]